MGVMGTIIRSIIGPGAPLRCVNCARIRRPGDIYVAGPKIYMCDACGADAAARLTTSTPDAAAVTCSFCGTTDRGVTLGAERRKAICSDCITLVCDMCDRGRSRMTD